MARRVLLAWAMLPVVTLAGCVDAPRGPRRPARSVSARMVSHPVVQPVPSSVATRACLVSLRQNAIGYVPVPDQYYGAGCSTLGSVRLAYLRSDSTQLGLANAGPVTCQLANALQGWARFGVDRAAQQILGSPLVKIETMGSYNCRNVAGTARRSAHATANAIDISGFLLADGRRVTVLRDWRDEDPQIRAFLRAIHTSACKRFNTVLSPDYNAAHRDHLHLEVGSGRPLCV
ncbi:extensin family protein [Novosphingobium capsulatum]|uniref:extensin family protein n=1 Tax=Novosphingobium capsulatum TaxID=13688 RepID=UPI0007880630|nr:extensin family protein [Novosphingobium capsulatum]WQD94004.1 extensin family protein [Novosphingobium capsulatum]